MFTLSPTPINSEQLTRDLTDPRAGAVITFCGVVRNHHHGRTVTQLEYEANPTLCYSEAAKILDEARQQFDILDVRCVHRTGTLAVGETAVWIGVAAGHRDAAFRASRFVIDEMKSRLPIWKKEYYTDGEPQWVRCECGVVSKW